MKTFKQHITEVKAASMYVSLYRKQKGIFYRGEGRGGKGTSIGALGAGIYLTWSETMAQVFADRLGSGGTVKKYKVKSGLKIAYVISQNVICVKAKMGFGPDEYSGDAMYANIMKMDLSDLGYHGVMSDEVAEGIVIFDKKNVKEVK